MRPPPLFCFFLFSWAIAGAQVPLVEPGGVVDAASFTSPVVPGSLISIFGEHLAAVAESATTVPLPFNLEGVSVSFNGVAAPLLFISAQQINAQLPWEVSTAGPVSVVVTNGATSSTAQAVQVGSFSPSLFSIDEFPGFNGGVFVG